MLRSIPPVLDPANLAAPNRNAVAYRAHLRRCFGESPSSVTTRTPVHVALAAAVVMPAIDRINREHIARWQEAEIGASDGL